MVTQLTREAGACVVGTGRAADRKTVLDFGAKEFVDLENEVLEDVGADDHPRPFVSDTRSSVRE